MNYRALLLGSAVAGALSLAASAASADVLKWTLQNAVFDDGGAASGSFDYNTVTEAYTNIDITTTAGTNIATGSTFTAFDVFSAVRDYGFGANVAGETALGDPLLDINTTADFNTPGVVSIGSAGGFISSEGTCATAGCTLYNPVRSLSGSVVSTVLSVPEPSLWVLMLAGFGGVGAMQRRSNRMRAANASA
jgi:hypothetical protein